jgi:hypothetical protein
MILKTVAPIHNVKFKEYTLEDNERIIGFKASHFDDVEHPAVYSDFQFILGTM